MACKNECQTVTQLPHDIFGTKTFSLKNAYITCIGEQLINTLNDNNRLGQIYDGLVQYILARHRLGRGVKQNLTRIAHHDCIRTPITLTLVLLKTNSGTHLISMVDKFPLLPTPLETQWMRQARNIHKPILHNITELKHITHPNGTHLMTNDEFEHYYNTPTRIENLR